MHELQDSGQKRVGILRPKPKLNVGQCTCTAVVIRAMKQAWHPTPSRPEMRGSKRTTPIDTTPLGALGSNTIWCCTKQRRSSQNSKQFSSHKRAKLVRSRPTPNAGQSTP
ncbi:hypothetical protein V6N12_062339 [Hibiscus sabdariffa]|uniref:Uncharacterized protein n=1 Tax=Hibiscus sabdariffa TaxID=183260 RepID=A0ABR2F8I9_9ROSI